MKPLIDPINTSDGKFHGKDKQTGDLATIVTPEYMNNDQDATRSMQREIISILTAADINPEEATDTQLLTALKTVLIAADDERVKNALQKGNNLSDVNDKAKALENIGGVPTTRKINGHALSADASVTAQDIFNGQIVDIGNAIDLNTLTTPGLYRQAANAQAASGKNYPEAVAGSLEVYKHAGITQVYRVYNNSRQYARTLYSGTWSAWGKVYDTNNKPSAGDVGALPITGGNVTGAVSFGGAKKFSINPQNSATLDAHLNHWGNTDRPTVLEFGDATSYHFYSQRNKDGSIIFTCAGTINPSIWTNFDARYYTQAAANGKFQPKGNYTPTGTAYTKAESDARYNLKNTAALAATGGWQQDGTTGLIIQMGIVNRTTYGTPVTFPKAFPNYCCGVLLTLNSYVSALDDSTDNIRALAHSKTGFTYGAAGDPEKTAFWVAFGK